MTVAAQPQTANAVSPPPLGRASTATARRPKRNPFAVDACEARDASREALAAAYAYRSEEKQSVDVMQCGFGGVAFTPEGELVCSARTGVPGATLAECGKRLCAECCRRMARRNVRKVQQKLLANDTEDDDVRFLTLTQPARIGETADDALDRLTSALRIMCRSKAWKENVTGGVLGLEIVRSSKKSRHERAKREEDEAARVRAKGWVHLAQEHEAEAARLRAEGSASWWHAHVHGLVIGCFWAQAELVAHWRSCLQRAVKTTTTREVRDVQFDDVPNAGQVDAFEPPVTTKRRAEERYTANEQRIFSDALGFYDERFIVVETTKHEYWHAEDDARVQRGEIKDYGGANIQRPKRGRDGAVKEVCKYVMKPMSFVGLGVELGAELIGALNGRRMLRTVGCLYGMKLEQEDKKATVRCEGQDDDDVNAPMDAFMGVTASGRQVRRAEVFWRTDVEAKEQRRARLAALWEHHQQAFAKRRAEEREREREPCRRFPPRS